MKVYLIVSKNRISKESISKLSKLSKVIILEKSSKDISKYKELFEDQEEKVIGISSERIEWSIPNKVIDKIPNLKGICTLSTWANFIDVDYCKSKGIVVCNSPDAASQSVAEYAIWMMLSLAKRLPEQINNNYHVELNPANLQSDIFGKKVGIVGLGNIGGRIANMCDALGMKVTYWSRNKKNVKYKYFQLEKLLKNSDYIFNCLEICEGTKNFFNKQRIDLMKSSGIFISVLGGAGWGVVDENYIIRKIEKGELGGLGVENEHQKAFKKRNNLKGNIFLPAAYAWYTNEAQQRYEDGMINAIIGVIKGRYVNILK